MHPLKNDDVNILQIVSWNNTEEPAWILIE